MYLSQKTSILVGTDNGRERWTLGLESKSYSVSRSFIVGLYNIGELYELFLPYIKIDGLKYVGNLFIRTIHLSNKDKN